MSISSVSPSRAIDTTENVDQIQMLADRLDALDASLANVLADSAVSVQPVDISHSSFENAWMTVERILDPAFPGRDVQSSPVKSLVSSIPMPRLYCHDGMITEADSVKRNCPGTPIENAIAERDVGKVEKVGFKLVLLDGRHLCSPMPRVNTEHGHECT